MVDEKDITGTTIAGRYIVEKRLAMGGMGAVYIAKQEPLGRDVALKVLRPSLLGDPVAVERFKSEAKIVAQLGHPHIISIYEFGTADDGMLFIAMELVRGNSLGNILRDQGAFPWQRALPIACSIARALGAAHARGVVHRDLKPDNVLLVDAHGLHDFVKVVDFGIAKLVRTEEHSPNLTGTGFVPGTPGYIAPEQIMGGGGNDDPRSDLYALGVTWYEMMTGRRPFDGDSAMKVFLQHLQEPIPKLRERLPGIDVPPEIERLVASLLAKNPDERPSDAEAFLAAVDASGLSIPSTPTHPSPVPHFTPNATHAATELGASLPTMTSLSTPGTAVRPFVTQAATQATPATATSTSATVDARAPTPTIGTALAATAQGTGPVVTPAEQQTYIEKLLRQRRFWVRFWFTAAPLMIVVIVALGLTIRHFKNVDEQERAERRAFLPIAAMSTRSPAEDAVAAAVMAYVDGDHARARTLAEEAAQQYPDEPVPYLVEAAVRDEKRGDDKLKLLQQAADKVAALRKTWGPAREGMDAVELLPRAYVSTDDGGKAFIAAFEACASCQASVLALAIAADACTSGLGDPDEALKLADRIIALEPTKSLGYERKVAALLKRADVHEAVHTADEGLKHAPHSPAMHLVAGRTRLATGELSEAIRELKAAHAGQDGNLALADAYLLEGDEKARTDIIQALRATAGDAHDWCSIAMEHGPTLVGAGRPRESLALIDDCLNAAHGDRFEIGNTLILALQAAEATNDPLFWQELGAMQARHHVTGHEQPEGVTLIVDAVVADVDGDIKTAHAKLDEMKRRINDPIWPPRAAKQVVAVVESRVAWREHRFDDALAATDQLERFCRVHVRRAEILRDAGRTTEARDEVRQVLERRDYCRAQTYEGVYTLEALVLQAELDNDAASADELRLGLQKYFAKAEPSLPLMLRARAALAKRDATTPPPSTNAP